MKNIFPFILLLLMLLGCNGKEKSDGIRVGTDELHLWPGTTKTLSILTNGTFSIESLDPTIAQATVDDQTIIVTADGIGRTNLILKDQIHDDLKISVSTVLMGLWTEEHEFEECAPKISVTADSKEIAENIKHELTTEMAELKYAHYGFETDGRFFLDFQKRGPNDTAFLFWGTFSWDGKTLVLNYDKKSEIYAFKGIYSGPRLYMFSATLNLTDKYKALYPNAGIKTVSVERILSAVPPFAYF